MKLDANQTNYGWTHFHSYDFIMMLDLLIASSCFVFITLKEPKSSCNTSESELHVTSRNILKIQSALFTNLIEIAFHHQAQTSLPSAGCLLSTAPCPQRSQFSSAPPAPPSSSLLELFYLKHSIFVLYMKHKLNCKTTFTKVL